MSYNQSDIFSRIKKLLPSRWFGEDTPILDSVLNSLAAGWIGFFNLLAYVVSQTRIGTAFDRWLDLIASDFFGYRVQRRTNESDDSFRARIILELIKDRCTRQALFQSLLEATGRPPTIFEPANPGDAGCYGLTASGEGTAGYRVSGGWGSLDLPFQTFVTAFRPTTPGVSMINGWSGDYGAFGGGRSAYMNGGSTIQQVTDAEIYREVTRVKPAGSIVWVSIRS
jgi:hypothetical protein